MTSPRLISASRTWPCSSRSSSPNARQVLGCELLDQPSARTAVPSSRPHGRRLMIAPGQDVDDVVEADRLAAGTPRG